jgi:hypothetical protein
MVARLNGTPMDPCGPAQANGAMEDGWPDGAMFQLEAIDWWESRKMLLVLW